MSDVLTSVTGSLARITLNRPEAYTRSPPLRPQHGALMGNVHGMEGVKFYTNVT